MKDWILEQPKLDCQMVEYDKGGGRRLLVGYTDDRVKKDAYTERREYAGWKRLTSMVRLMTNDLNGHEQWRTYGVHLYVTYGGTFICHSWGTFTCHFLGYAYMSLFERQGVRVPILLEIF